MNRAELHARLEEAQRSSLGRARLLLDGIRPLAAAPLIDAPMRLAIEQLARRCGESVVVRAAHELRVGETWLLLVGAGGRADVVRLCAHGEGAEGGLRFEEETARALRGLRAASAARGRHIPIEVYFRRFTVLGGAEGLTITGSSLALAACIAALSFANKAAPNANVAGSAAVDEAGNLLLIEGIGPKLRALRAQWPSVDTVVVAGNQADVPADLGMTVIRAATLADAWAAFGLDLPAEAPPSWETLERRIGALEHEERHPHSVEAWGRLSIEAEAISTDLLDHDPERSAGALLLAGLMASHAGDPQRARAVLARFPAGVRPGMLVARERVVTASASIEIDPELALAAAVEGVALCKEHDPSWSGRAIGTHGRVLLHAGRAAEAEPLLRDALARHETDRDEWPRSAVYLAQCLRHLGRAAEALALAEDALRQAEANTRSEQSKTTRLYALLEQGRALLELGRTEEAIRALEEVVAGQPTDAAYPSLGARRSLVRAYGAVGNPEAARRHLRVCLALAGMRSESETLRKVGAVAGAEARLALKELGPLADDIEVAWTLCFGASTTEATVGQWIY